MYCTYLFLPFWLMFLSHFFFPLCFSCCIGESGLGKSTLVNTLFKSKISRTSCTPGPHIIPRTTEVNSVSHGEIGSWRLAWNLLVVCAVLGAWWDLVWIWFKVTTYMYFLVQVCSILFPWQWRLGSLWGIIKENYLWCFDSGNKYTGFHAEPWERGDPPRIVTVYVYM